MPSGVSESSNDQSKSRSTFDRFVLALGIVESFTTLPQLYQIWVKHETAGVSAITWFSYAIVECIWFAYGKKQQDRAIMAGSLSWGIMELLVAIGAIIN
jgi:uncharacterized protein with PQ loop repeat